MSFSRFLRGFGVWGVRVLSRNSELQEVCRALSAGSVLTKGSGYSKPHKVGNRIKAKECWDSLYFTL